MSDEFEKITFELCEKLSNVRDSRDFVVGILTNVQDIEGRKKMIDFLDYGEDDVTVPNIIMYSVVLNEEREEEKMTR